MSSDAQKEIATTTRWGISLLIGLLVQTGAVFYWAANLESRVEQNDRAIEKIEVRVDNITDDIRAILVGIEQVKGRLGIIEINP